MFKKNEIKSAEPSPYNFEYMNAVSGNPGSALVFKEAFAPFR